MENMRWKNQQMGMSKPEFRCKQHMKHTQSPGVCSVCLGERLSQLSTSSCSTTMATSFSSRSSLSSRYSSFLTSPVHRRTSSEAKGSFSFLKSGKNVLTKSRSMAFAPRIGGEAVDGKKKKKRGFWSKLLRRRSKRMDEGLVHLVPRREMTSAKLQ